MGFSLESIFFKDFWKRLLQLSRDDNTGMGASVSIIRSGDGEKSALAISDDAVFIRPVNDDSTSAFTVRAASGNVILVADTSNGLVKVNTSQVYSTTQYAYFGVGSVESSGMIADRHYMIPFNMATIPTIGDHVIGTGTDPDTTLTITGTADGVTTALWYVPDAITIDAVHWFHGADDATGDVVRAHLMSYQIDTGNSATSGDLSGGTVLADGADITNAGYEQVYYQSMTIQSANVAAGRVIAFVFRADSVNSDMSINATVKYHIQ